jgi:hypothetical protein
MKKGGALLRCKRVNAVAKFQTKKRREIKEGHLTRTLIWCPSCNGRPSFGV